jgi:hypothetical protein
MRVSRRLLILTLLIRSILRSGHSSTIRRRFPALDLPLDVPHSLLEILDGIALQVSTPDVLDGVAETKAHVLGDLYALDTAGVLGVVLGVVDGVVVHALSCVALRAEVTALRAG